MRQLKSEKKTGNKLYPLHVQIATGRKPKKKPISK